MRHAIQDEVSSFLYCFASFSANFCLQRRKRYKVNGLLSVDAISGEEYLQLKSKAKSEDIASYFANLCDDLSNLGDRQVTIILDNNSTYKDKMKFQLRL